MVSRWRSLLPLFLCCRALHIDKGTSGTEYHKEGLTDKQLGIIRWLWNMTYLDDSGRGSWAGFPSGPGQIGQEKALRYPLAFAAYAVASASFEHIPAARTGPARLLHNIFLRLIDKRVWGYWSAKKQCAAPWSQVCKLTDKSMCDIAASWYEKDPVCPDPLTRANVMLSGHVAQVGVLFEAFGDDRLSVEGWDLHTKSWSRHFTLPSLLEALSEQAVETARMGGGITCEPGMVYPSCNSHVHSAYRLYDALHQNSVHQKLTSDWRSFLSNHTSYNPHWGNSKWVFRIMMRNRMDGSLARTIGGCGSHDGWVLAWMPAWDGGETLEQKGMNNFLRAKGWTFPKPNQSFFHDDCFDQTEESQRGKSWLATSFFVAIATRHPAARERAQQVYRFLEEYGQIIPGMSGEAEQFFYLVNGENETLLTESMWVTSNALRGMTERRDTLAELYGAPGRLAGPSIVVDWPKVLVRQALWQPSENLLRFTILGSAKVEIELDGRDLKNVTLDGNLHAWRFCGNRACLFSHGEGDHRFLAHFAPMPEPAPRRHQVLV